MSTLGEIIDANEGSLPFMEKDSVTYQYNCKKRGDSNTALLNRLSDNAISEHATGDTGWDEYIPPAPQTTKEIRDECIANELPNWGSLSIEDKQKLVRCFVYPSTETEQNLDALYPKSERDQYMFSTISKVVLDTPVVKNKTGDVRYFKQLVDNSSLELIELKCDEVF